jgi:hypothetical protein
MVSLLAFCAPGMRGQQTHFPVNATPWSYVVPPYPSHCLQTYRLFLPDDPTAMPADGWPVVVHVKLAGFQRSEDTSVLGPSHWLSTLLERNVAVITARVTPSIHENDPLWLDWCTQAPDIPGHGLFHPPGFVPPDLATQGIAPYEDRDYHMAEKDGVMLLQHVRYKARQTGCFQSDQDVKMSLLDHRRIAVHGRSAAAITMAWAVLGPDRRHGAPFAGLTGQYAEPSRADVVALDGGALWWPSFSPDLVFPLSHFGDQGHSETAALRMADVLPVELLGNSALYYEDYPANDDLPLYLKYGDNSVSEQYQMRWLNCAPYPFCFDDQGMEGVLGPTILSPNYHAAWNGYAYLTGHPGSTKTRLVVTDQIAFGQAGSVPTVALYPQPGQTAAEVSLMETDDVVSWLVTELDGLLDQLPPSPWHQLGDGLAGVAGVPTLRGQGTLLAGDPFTLTITDTFPNSPTVIVTGFDQIHMPAMGGVLVPRPDALLIGAVVSDAAGTLTLNQTWPPGVPSGSPVFYQFWFLDAGGPHGLSASNGLQATPP